MDEGTGVVHMAQGFGEDDQRIADDNGIPTVVLLMMKELSLKMRTGLA